MSSDKGAPSYYILSPGNEVRELLCAIFLLNQSSVLSLTGAAMLFRCTEYILPLPVPDAYVQLK